MSAPKKSNLIVNSKIKNLTTSKKSEPTQIQFKQVAKTKTKQTLVPTKSSQLDSKVTNQNSSKNSHALIKPTTNSIKTNNAVTNSTKMVLFKKLNKIKNNMVSMQLKKTTSKKEVPVKALKMSTFNSKTSQVCNEIKPTCSKSLCTDSIEPKITLKENSFNFSNNLSSISISRFNKNVSQPSKIAPVDKSNNVTEKQASMLPKKSEFLLVKWIVDEKFSIIHKNDIIENEELRVEKKYLARYDDDFLECIIKSIGSKQDLEIKLNSISNYSNVNKKRKTHSDYKINQADVNSQSLEKQELDLVNQRLVEYEKKISQIESENVKLKSQIEIKENEISQIKNLFDEFMIEKMINCSINVLTNFATREQIESIYSSNECHQKQIVISSQYPNIVVSDYFKSEIDNLVKSNATDSVVFRRIIGFLIPSFDDWSSRNGKSIINDFNSQVYASFDYVFRNRPNFTLSEMRKTLRYLCAESKRIVNKSKGDCEEIIDNESDGDGVIDE
ncbi:unnamed protein product [Brachionus calyciflorus]|uniref:Uncharacterized protein n=1 Tax=Brachionus calyciflorus TaxID=104777 RepID=A0A814JF74_9BILA|nr:unnamed protein product [Brachionus calyciflorus]